jgi:predicted DNA-binding transcriptional regulator AlpA
MATTSNQLPETGFLRIWHIVGNKKTNIPALIPISRTSFLNGVKSGKYPKPVKLGERTTAWKVEDIRNLIISINQSSIKKPIT